MKLRALGTREKEGDSMKEWAKDFYNSTAWRETREAYLVSQQYVCERCEEPATMVHHKTWLTRHNITRPELTLCWDKLEALCQDCHNKEHHKTKRHGRYKFDADGNVIEG